MRRFMTMAVAALLLAGCTTTAAIRSSAKTATAIALVQAEASLNDAVTIRDLASGVKGSVAGDGPYDTMVIRAMIASVISNSFGCPGLPSGEVCRREVIYMLVVDELVELIVAELVNSTNIPEDERAFIEAAAGGVESGATIYITAAQP